MMRWIPDRAIERLRSGAAAPDLSSTRYRLIEAIGHGGMGVVYRAEDLPLGRHVALKVLDAVDPSGELAARLAREARVLAQLEHPGIVPIHDVGELGDGRTFYTMKLVRGHRLDRYLAQSPSLAERLRVFARICEAVAFAHSRGVLHRDLKPQNIMVGSFGEVLVMDWGVAKVLKDGPDGEETTLASMDRSMGGPAGSGDGQTPERTFEGLDTTQHGVVLGTRGYMAPEQARGEIASLDARTDVYSLGAVLRFLLSDASTASAPEAEAATEATPSAIDTSGQPARRSAGVPVRLPRRLRAIVEKAVSPSPDDRYAGANELAEDTQRFLEGRTVRALSESMWSRAGRFVAQHYVAFILIFVYVLVRTLVLVFLER
jgi:serine/threonine protein kinase